MFRTELNRLSDQLKTPPTGITETLAVLDEVTVLHRAVIAARALIAANAGPLVQQALELGVDPRELTNRPYNARFVADLYRQAGLPARKPGPTPARRQI